MKMPAQKLPKTPPQTSHAGFMKSPRAKSQRAKSPRPKRAQSAAPSSMYYKDLLIWLFPARSRTLRLSISAYPPKGFAKKLGGGFGGALADSGNLDSSAESRTLFSADSGLEANSNSPESSAQILDSDSSNLKSSAPSLGHADSRVDSSLDSTSSGAESATSLYGAPFIKLSHRASASAREIYDFIEANETWLRQVIARIAQRSGAQNDVLARHPNEILLFGEWVAAIPLGAVKSALESYLRERTKILAESMGLRYSKLGVRASCTRFGSCAGDRLSFSLLLAFAPKEQIDYVIIHELSHITHKNHSARFWNLVAAHCPRWKILRKELKDNYAIYRALLESLAGS